MKTIHFPTDIADEAINALLKKGAGKKTQIRIPLDPQPRIGSDPAGPYIELVDKQGDRVWEGNLPGDFQELVDEFCPYGQPGDQLALREAWATRKTDGETRYRADADPVDRNQLAWQSATSMGFDRVRYVLEVEDVWIERLQDVDEDDARKEVGLTKSDPDPIKALADYWDRAWKSKGLAYETNPWAWVLTVRIYKARTARETRVPTDE